MEKMRDFLREHGMVCAVILCACAAVLTGAWAVHTIQKEMGRPVPPETKQEPQDGVLPELPRPGAEWEEKEWNNGLDVAGPAEGVPENRSADGAQDSSALSSGQSSSGDASSEDADSAGSADAAATLYGPPVSGSTVQAFSGDELVYNETLADWRTHNGVDYACALGSEVKAPAAGTVAAVGEQGNWGSALELTDAEGRTWRLCGVVSTLQVGDTVTCGQVVGQVSGITCEATLGSHVHLEVEKDGVYQDPAAIIG